jgi:hypothetical protein
MKRFVRPLLLLAVPLALAAVVRIAPLPAQDAAPGPATAPAPADPPVSGERRPAERPPAQEDDMAPEAAPGDRISADNNVSFPVDI